MKYGIMGGTFDPVHSGHIAVAEAVAQRLGLDRVLMMPSGEPPYRRCRASREQRMALMALACEGHEGLVPCDVEVRRPGKTYTVDTLRALKVGYPGVEWVYIIGADVLQSVPNWRGIDEITPQVTFAVAARPGAELGALPPGIRAMAVDVAGPEVSSGMVRERVAEGLPIDGLVPEAVADRIRGEGLYLCDHSEAEILERLRRTITLHRYHHTLGVADTAERLAERCGVDPRRARLAGLLHDCAKSQPYGEMRKLVEENVPDTDALELDAEPVLHAPAGMVLARRDYGARDPVILQAIRRHTLGGPDMTAMDALIYVSDFIEPGRRPFPGLEAAREAAERDIFEALRLSARLSSDYLISHGHTPHPRTLAMLEELNEKLR